VRAFEIPVALLLSPHISLDAHFFEALKDLLQSVDAVERNFVTPDAREKIQPMQTTFLHFNDQGVLTAELRVHRVQLLRSDDHRIHTNVGSENLGVEKKVVCHYDEAEFLCTLRCPARP
jgi:hypothetical protein